MRKHYVSTFRYLARIRSSVARSVRSIGVNYHFGVVVTLFILFSVCFSGVAQPTISYPVNSVDSLTRGMGSGKLAVNIGFTSACTSINVEIRLPGGVRYVPGTVTSTGGTGGLTIQDNGGPVNRPQFLISNAAAGNNIVFTIDRIANCGQGASGKDSVYVTSSCGNVSELGANVNTYNILSPSLVLSPPPAVANANIGSSYSRS
jgi:hypothetical protein